MKKFRHWLDWLKPRRRRTGQGVVEFGLIVAGVAVVGIAGLTVLGRAEEGYFIPLAQALAGPAPTGSEDVVHPTDVVIVNCSPPSAAATVLTNISCTFTVRDMGGAPRTWPEGSVHLMFGATDLGSCALAQDFAPPPDSARSTCTVSISWTFGVADVNPPQPRKLAAHYIPTDSKHHAPAMDPFATISIHQPLTLAVSCVNPWDAPAAVEPGHPVKCTATATEGGSSGPPWSDSNPLTLTWTAATGSGLTMFHCYSSTTFASLDLPPCWTPAPSSTATCTTNPATIPQTVPPTPRQCIMMYQRKFADIGMPISPGNEVLTVTESTMAPTPATATISLQAPNAHDTFVTTDCRGNPAINPLPTHLNDGYRDVYVVDRVGVPPHNFQPTNSLQLVALKHIDTTINTVITCTVVAFDTEWTPGILQFGCKPFVGLPLSCNAEFGTGSPPLGLVQWEATDSFTAVKSPITDMAGSTCATTGLGHWSPSSTRPGTLPGGEGAYVQPLLRGEPEYASWCQSVFQVPVGSSKIQAKYLGDAGLNAHRPAGSSWCPIGSASPDDFPCPIDIHFH